MATMFIRHAVSDYAKWRKAYDGFAQMQKANGVIAKAVYQSADNPNEITVTHDFATVAAAQAFSSNPDLRAAMQSSGVVGVPTVWFTNKV